MPTGVWSSATAFQVPPEVTGYIDGPDWVQVSSTHTWQTSATGGHGSPYYAR